MIDRFLVCTFETSVKEMRDEGDNFFENLSESIEEYTTLEEAQRATRVYDDDTLERTIIIEIKQIHVFDYPKSTSKMWQPIEES